MLSIPRRDITCAFGRLAMRVERIINSVAPIRINDLGGWTDTWFAGYGAVLNMAVYPYVQCQMEVMSGDGIRPLHVTIHAENYRDQYTIRADDAAIEKHPLLEAAIHNMGVPADREFFVNLYSQAPGGCSTGTSAAVSVALIGALAAAGGIQMTPAQVAAKAQEIETVDLKQQCGIQDQIASAYGGICFIEMYQYPHATVSSLDLPRSLWWELEQRLSLIYVGRTHKSSDVHNQVIAELERDKGRSPVLEKLRGAAHHGKDAILSGDLRGFGKAMIQNTEAQRELSSFLIGSTAQKIIDVAKKWDAWGWKVNGAGGEGGSLTILSCAKMSHQRKMLEEIEALGQGIRHIPTYLSRYGLRVWASAP
jgi:D-glycero-alpha-D-manno-heptose-7-phosphate kinase